MAKIKYVERKFSKSSLAIIASANRVIADYLRAGFMLTLRQLYYQFISQDLFPDSWTDEALGTKNTQRNYKRLGSIINDGRLAGLIDWRAIEDRTRNLHRLSTWDGPAEIIETCAEQYRIDLWEGQEWRPEVWVEKEALAGVFQVVCDELRVPFFACRGYTSQSEMQSAGERMRAVLKNDQDPVILHFGDHDPSGVYMTRDIKARLELFMGQEIKLERLALNMAQIEEFDPPPSPAKTSDARARGYIAEHGTDSWELDALEPNVLAGLVREAIGRYRREGMWRRRVALENEHRETLRSVSRRWDEISRQTEE